MGIKRQTTVSTKCKQINAFCLLQNQMNTLTGTCKLRLQVTIYSHSLYFYVLDIVMCRTLMMGFFFTYADGGACWPTHDL